MQPLNHLRLSGCIQERERERES
jgi:hypothetical protein